MEDKKTTEFYKKLESDLALDTKWPAPYLYKFIVPSSQEKVVAIEAVFKGQNAKISTRTSSKGKFTSISVALTLENPKAVIANYRAVAKIEGVISL